MHGFIFNGSDLRLHDNLGLNAAAKMASKEGTSLHIFFITDASTKFESIHATKFRALILRELRTIAPIRVIHSLSDLPSTIKCVHINHLPMRETELEYERKLKSLKIAVEWYDDWSALTSEMPKTYMIYTPFFNKVFGHGRRSLESNILKPKTSVKIDDKIPYRTGIYQAAKRCCTRAYDHDIGSGVSKYISAGVISLREAIYMVMNSGKDGWKDFVRELLWREFYYQIAEHEPELLAITGIKDGKYKAINLKQETNLKKWLSARTEWDYINTALLHLRDTGEMPNRLRMIVAECLTSVNYYHVPWWFGADYFEKYLTDYDPILNRCNWLWVAGIENPGPYIPWAKAPFQGFNLERQAKHRAVKLFLASQ